jgi:SpoVK/Ycf46/Vps4 family AAA+-type ATPase
MSGSNDRILVLAATNMPWDVDPAMKRPGRFDRRIFVPPPDEAARAEMFRLELRGVPADALDLAAIASGTAHLSGADVDGIIEDAKEQVLAEILASGAERPLRPLRHCGTAAGRPPRGRAPRSPVHARVAEDGAEPRQVRRRRRLPRGRGLPQDAPARVTRARARPGGDPSI